MSSGGVNVKAVVTNSANGEPAVGASLQVKTSKQACSFELLKKGDEKTWHSQVNIDG